MLLTLHKCMYIVHRRRNGGGVKICLSRFLRISLAPHYATVVYVYVQISNGKEEPIVNVMNNVDKRKFNIPLWLWIMSTCLWGKLNNMGLYIFWLRTGGRLYMHIYLRMYSCRHILFYSIYITIQLCSSQFVDIKVMILCPALKKVPR